MSGSVARLCGLALVAVLAVTSALQAQTSLEQKQREWAIQAQQTVADVMAALDKSRQLEKTSAAEAKSLLEKNLLVVNDSNALDEKQRADLRGRLLSRLKEVDATAREQKLSADNAAKAADEKAARLEKERMEQAKIQSMQKSTYDQAKDKFDNANKSIASQKQSQAAREKGFTDLHASIDKTATKMTEERITQHFIDISNKRKQKLTKQEEAVLKALNSTISVDFSKDRGDTFKDVLSYLTEKAKAAGGQLNIFPDEASLRDAAVEYETKVNFKAEKVTVRTVLKKVLADVGLTFVIKDGNVHVITPDRMKDYTVVRYYPVQDLMAPINPRFGPAVANAQRLQQANQLILMITQTIDPSSWQGLGERGFGTITYDPASMSLVIRHTAEMHFMLNGGFGGR
ncbi:MAG TPA: hypothetical protein VE988_16430 [Gemmataceae bacterium]|nr:hypothetical protein [Gemmataceae bacterium]